MHRKKKKIKWFLKIYQKSGFLHNLWRPVIKDVMENADFYDGPDAEKLAVAYQDQDRDRSLDLLLIFVLLFFANQL